jgi:hypothetical protein
MQQVAQIERSIYYGQNAPIFTINHNNTVQLKGYTMRLNTQAHLMPAYRDLNTFMTEMDRQVFVFLLLIYFPMFRLMKCCVTHPSRVYVPVGQHR